jgi:5-methylcytosine-specific restriction endonuclease McrA
MQCVFVIDSEKKPCAPCHPARAKELLDKQKASVWQYSPFTIILKSVVDVKEESIRIKIDPGSVTTGMCLVKDSEVIFAMNLTHRAHAIVSLLKDRRVSRSSRRGRKTRYRPARSSNRSASKQKGWIAPSLHSRLNNIVNWIIKLRKVCNITDCSIENVKFDTQLMENSEISGVEYCQGTLYGYEIREYLLEKYNRTCVYCGATNVPFEIDHVIPKDKGGGNRLDNLVIACHRCNQAKTNLTLEDFKKKLKLDFKVADIQKDASKLNLKNAAHVNITRYRIVQLLKPMFNGKIELGSGALTKMNRVNQGYIKDHWIDAACIGESGKQVKISINQVVLEVKAMGRGNRRVCNNDKYGFTNTKPKSKTGINGVQTGDIIKLYNKLTNTNHIGKCSLGGRGYPYIVIKNKHIQGKFKILQKSNGYICVSIITGVINNEIY